jgi:hypothetical protein
VTTNFLNLITPPPSHKNKILYGDVHETSFKNVISHGVPNYFLSLSLSPPPLYPYFILHDFLQRGKPLGPCCKFLDPAKECCKYERDT